ncbi:MAG TPA: PilT/PilU family type 4a pilus ATPase [Dehalococcoidia bacterium]|nr:PilT/PilU family type 4a pilus ATPase [Dehalococcoidia bacterium]
MAMKRLLELMSEKNASDIFVSVGAPISIKINGVTMPINQQIVTPDAVRALMAEILNERQLKEFAEEWELNTSYPMPGLGSFRVSCFIQRTTPALVVRFIPRDIPAFDTLGLPPVLKEVVLEKRGLILMVGATGSGKSTSLAAMIDYRNTSTPGHIITIEDPIEFLFKHKRSIVNQRELGTDSKSYHVALKNALRQAPDVILIGEIRDRESMSMAIAYAQSGHLCLATLHANNSYHTLNRIISFYPLESRPALLSDLSATLRVISSQRLVKTTKGSRCPAVEVLLNTRHIAELIEEGKINEIKEAIDKSLSPGSQTFEQALFRMYREGIITQEEALANADSANNLLWLMNNADQAAMQPAAPKPAAEQQVERVPGGASFSEFKLTFDDKAA